MKKKELIMFFGRTNPTTWAHEVIFKSVRQMAEERSCDHMVFITHTHAANKTNNPLPPNIKEKWSKLIAPDINFMLTGTRKAPGKTIIETVNNLAKKGYYKITIVAGEDRQDMKELLDKYQDPDYPVEIEFISSGIRSDDPAAIGMESVSATRLREACYALCFEEAQKLMPKSLDERQKFKFYIDILHGAGVLKKVTAQMKKRFT